MDSGPIPSVGAASRNLGELLKWTTSIDASTLTAKTQGQPTRRVYFFKCGEMIHNKYEQTQPAAAGTVARCCRLVLEIYATHYYFFL